jgi:integrase/recombinase XerC
MSTELVPIEYPPLPSPRPAFSTSEELLASWLAGRSPRTVRAYQADLRHFWLWMLPGPFGKALPDGAGVACALDYLLSMRPGDANFIVMGYVADQLAARLSAATISRRLAALRSVVKLARRVGRITWNLDVDAPRPEARRDVRGPDKADRKKLWKSLEGLADSPKARRDRAVVALLFDLGLRRGEALALDLADVGNGAETVAIVGKGKREKEPLTLPSGTRVLLLSWMECRGEVEGPLFVRLDHGCSRGRFDRLTGDGLARVIKGLGLDAGLGRRLRPHGLRHASITAALDAGEDIRNVRKFSRHKRLETVLRYDDARDDAAARIAGKVSRERK